MTRTKTYFVREYGARIFTLERRLRKLEIELEDLSEVVCGLKDVFNQEVNK